MASIIRLTSTWAAGPRKYRPFADGRERDISTLIGRRSGRERRRARSPDRAQVYLQCTGHRQLV